MYNYKRVTLLCGHYGSGKTNVAVNMALELAALGKNTAVADLDIVNPYFRTKDSKEDFEAAGVRVKMDETSGRPESVVITGAAASEVDMEKVRQNIALQLGIGWDEVVIR